MPRASVVNPMVYAVNESSPNALTRMWAGFRDREERDRALRIWLAGWRPIDAKRVPSRARSICQVGGRALQAGRMIPPASLHLRHPPCHALSMEMTLTTEASFAPPRRTD